MATPTKTYKPKVHIGIDTETLGIPGDSAIVEIGAVIVLGNVPPATLHIKIKPSCYEGTQFRVDQETIDWHNKQHPEYLADLEANGVSFQEATTLYNSFLLQYKGDYDLHVWSQGKDFDFPKLDFLLKAAGIPKAPYSYSNIHCARDLVWLNPAARISGGGTSAVHTAVEDATWMARQIRAVVERNNWYQRLFA